MALLLFQDQHHCDFVARFGFWTRQTLSPHLLGQGVAVDYFKPLSLEETLFVRERKKSLYAHSASIFNGRGQEAPANALSDHVRGYRQRFDFRRSAQKMSTATHPTI